ncbi:MAG: hypothetical protein BGO55_00410 [Sphingobacteriales bacterium 50-39]|nr:MAG: hypothetical protein BGO55_00410 [Sphingobacteriales bacterium 50-39]
MLLLSLAIAPGIAISLFIYSFRKMGGTSVRQLIISFLLGMCATIPPFLIQLATGDVRDEPYRHSILSFAWFAFVIVALTEEGSKYLVVRWYAYPLDQFQEPFDGVIYSVITGMGFATVENIEYVWKFGVETGVARMFLSVPAHAAFAVLMGYNIGLAKFQPERKRWLMAKALLIVVLLHGSFDFFLFLKQSQTALEHVSDGMLSFCAFTSFYIAIRQAWKAIRLHTVREHDDDQEVN